MATLFLMVSRFESGKRKAKADQILKIEKAIRKVPSDVANCPVPFGLRTTFHHRKSDMKTKKHEILQNYGKKLIDDLYVQRYNIMYKMRQK
jgi:hypothetical protein